MPRKALLRSPTRRVVAFERFLVMSLLSVTSETCFPGKASVAMRFETMVCAAMDDIIMETCDGRQHAQVKGNRYHLPKILDVGEGGAAVLFAVLEVAAKE